MDDITSELVEIVGASFVTSGSDISDDDRHDEALNAEWGTPMAVARPGTTAEVARILRLCDEHAVPVTARGSGTGLSGAANPRHGGVLVAFDRMDRILEIDLDNHMAVVQPGVTLEQLDAAARAARPRLSRVPGRVLRQPRRQRQHERRRHARR